VNYRAIHALSYFSNSYGFKPDNFPVDAGQVED